MSPMIIPITLEMATATNPTLIETRAP